MKPDALKSEQEPQKTSNHYAPIQQYASHSSNKARVIGKVIIVTGANSILGIGRAAAHQFALNEAKAVYLCDYLSDHLDTHRQELNSLYPNVHVEAVQLDAANEKDIAKLVDRVLARHGRLDVFFANAGVTRQMSLIGEASSEDFMEVMRINALSVFLAVKHGSRGMQVTSADKPAPGGSIIATASVAGLRSNAGPTDYSASKAAVISIIQTTCYQLANLNIRTAALCPGIIETGMTKPMYEVARARGTEAKIGQLNPLRRGGLADEVARVALFLASDDSSYINGQAIAVDGGLSAGHPFVPGKFA